MDPETRAVVLAVKRWPRVVTVAPPVVIAIGRPAPRPAPPLDRPPPRGALLDVYA